MATAKLVLWACRCDRASPDSLTGRATIGQSAHFSQFSGLSGKREGTVASFFGGDRSLKAYVQ
ncbi:hypothetical protein C8Q74DRAFT_1302058 [Fomes fomentarius]|nr:hypothetical protein C8Q74DRAFT_1302058 [Fomes fomentarius]